MLNGDDIGPALRRLREDRGFTQEQVAVRLERTPQTISKLEQRGSNPKATTLCRYLNAIGAGFADLGGEIDGGDLLADFVRESNERIRTEPEYRRRAAELLGQLGSEEPIVRDLAQLIVDAEQRYQQQIEDLRSDLERRVHQLEKRDELPGGEDLAPNGTED